jgi:hypothetical protein
MAHSALHQITFVVRQGGEQLTIGVAQYKRAASSAMVKALRSDGCNGIAV